MGDGKLLEVRDLTVCYNNSEGTVHAVNNVGFSLNKGETLALVGETGAGKTTIAKAILRILNPVTGSIEAGEILYNGHDILKLNPKEMQQVRGNEITMIFQDPMTALNPVKTIGKQIAEVVELHNGRDKRDAKKRAVEMLEMVGIPAERYNEYPHQFSGGMKQRVVIAIALACSPELLLADEPTTALDVTIQAQVLDMMRELIQKQETAMILITHDLGVVAGTCDKVAIVYAGNIVEIGTKEDIFIHPSHPYTVGLFGAIPSMQGDARRLTPIEGMPADPSNLPKGCCFWPRCPYAAEACRQGDIAVEEISPGHFCKCIHKGA
ncbi:MAG: ABC transporter ATP-binding protein [Clostridiaceae bacterium]|nr:ABC transporter ATP-binding protein [Clostridiaceae bacterium]